MSKRQYLRLTLVFGVLFLILSFWISLQDFILPRGQFVHCSLRQNLCFYDRRSLDNIQEIRDNPNLEFLQYELPDYEKLLVISIPGLSAKVSVDSKDVSSVFNLQLLTNPGNICIFGPTPNGSYYYYCSEIEGFPSNSPYSLMGYFELSSKDKVNFDALIQQGVSKFNNDLGKRSLVAILIFAAFLAIYFVLSAIIYFVIYGIGKKKDT
ncbi:hypothetical protein [Acinetobacter radioresistens]|uniref:hypothetical protein n=1 Tax=Acinetobacter radioresistens TaxID=40216 RepID=UPI000C32611E|nr:hypothetical protein [Acinetobacter radioresistens]PKH30486.1 hypothetical protein BJF94_09730 [Acinetobacter radioresistens]